MKNLTKYLASLCLVVALLVSGKANAQQSLTSITGWNAYVHLPANYATSGVSYPTIVFFPGLGEVGTVASKVIASGPGAYITQGWNGNVSVNGSTVEFIVISIQPSAAYPNEIRLNQAIQAIKSSYRVDNNRLYLTGLSHGGWCSSTFVSGDAYGGPYNYASQIAAVVTVQGMRPDDNSPYPNLFDNYANAGGRYLGFEQTLDNRDTKTVVDRMNATEPNSAIYVQTNFGGGGHCCWNEYYGGGGKQPGNFMLDGISQNIYQWMARQSLNGTTPPPPPPANTPPVANAGSDKTITLPVNSTTLNGSGTDANGTISSYKWALFYGPSVASISNSTSANATISGLVQGTYQVDLTVTDNNGATATDRMQVIVNAAAVIPNTAPTANAGSYKIITLPTNNITISGTGTDPDGTVSAYAWTKISGPTSGSITNATSAIASLSGLVQGVYQYQLKVTDNNGATDTDNMQVTVNAAPVPPASGNQLPVINAGADITVAGGTYASLNGNGSDPDGWMKYWQWRKISGPASEPISNASAANAGAGGLVTGVYTFELEGTDNEGGKGRDTMLVLVGGATVPPVTNQIPVANAGSDKNITLPVSSTSLSGTGTDTDGSITSYLWTKISGPSATIASASSAATNITGLAQGVYIFELRVTDNSNASATDRIQVTVNASAPVPPPPSGGKKVNVNIHSGSSTYTNSQWNNWNLASLTSSALLFEDGSASGIKATFTSNDRIVDNGTNYATTATTVPSPVLRFNSAQTSNRDLVFSGLTPGKSYSFAFYGSRKGTGNKTVYTIGNQTDTVSTDNNINDVARFTNITPDNSGRVYVTLSRIGTWHYIAGFTVSESDENRIITSASPSQSIMGTQPSTPAISATAGNELTGVRAYPNPFMNSIRVDLAADITGKYTINVIDASGKILVTKNGQKGNMSIIESINVSHLPYGIYFIEIRSDKGRAVHTLKKILPVQM